jgi:hypothetical protein
MVLEVAVVVSEVVVVVLEVATKKNQKFKRKKN